MYGISGEVLISNDIRDLKCTRVKLSMYKKKQS